MYPIIKKAKKILGKNILFREVNTEDSKFILELRKEYEFKKYITETDNSINSQINWIKKYQNDLNQAYFIICDKNLNDIGCIRIYDAFENNFWWGSWILKKGLNPLYALESILLLYSYAKFLGFKDAMFDVRKNNYNVWNFHEKITGAVLINESDKDRFYILNSFKINKLLVKYQKIMHENIKVI
jgi:hypothetical protein